MTPETELVIDFDAPESKTELYRLLNVLIGKQRIRIKQWREKRTIAQNKYWHAACVKPLADHLRMQGTPVRDQQIHDMLRSVYLTYEVVDQVTGVIVELTRSTTDLDVKEMAELIEEVQADMLTEHGIQPQKKEAYAV